MSVGEKSNKNQVVVNQGIDINSQRELTRTLKERLMKIDKDIELIENIPSIFESQMNSAENFFQTDATPVYKFETSPISGLINTPPEYNRRIVSE